jgi:hypothetical protein
MLCRFAFARYVFPVPARRFSKENDHCKSVFRDLLWFHRFPTLNSTLSATSVPLRQIPAFRTIKRQSRRGIAFDHIIEMRTS